MTLNNLKQLKNPDFAKVAESITSLSKQIEDVFDQAEKVDLPGDYKNIDRVVVSGMGGSSLGARIIASVFKDRIKVPILIESGYEVPAYVDKNTFFIISSYSGNTEEPLSAFAEAKNRGAKIAGLAESGANKLTALLKKEGLPGFVFSPEQNPSGQPRLGLGYAVFALLALLSRDGVMNIDKAEIAQAISFLEKNNSRLDPASPEIKNQAKKIAQGLFNREIVLVGAEFLEGNLHALRNQLCENSKNFAQYLVMPDMNHYAMEGLSCPAASKKNKVFVFFSSQLYHPRVQKRCRLTEEVVRKNKIKVIEIKLSGSTKLIQAAELLQLGSWITFYLSVLNKANPILIPWVDWFKKKLA